MEASHLQVVLPPICLQEHSEHPGCALSTTTKGLSEVRQQVSTPQRAVTSPSNYGDDCVSIPDAHCRVSALLIHTASMDIGGAREARLGGLTPTSRQHCATGSAYTRFVPITAPIPIVLHRLLTR